MQRPVPGQHLVGSDGVVFDPVGLGVRGQRQAVGDVFSVEPFVLQRFEATLPDPVLAGGADSGPDVRQLGSGGDERGEAGGAERPAVVASRW